MFGNMFTVLLSMSFLTLRVALTQRTPVDECFRKSNSLQREVGTFQNLLKNGINVIFMDLVYSWAAKSDNSEFFEQQKVQRWVWIRKKFQYVLGYPEDVDVYSFGLLKAKQVSLSVNISIGNFSEVCKSKFYIYISHYLLQITNKNMTYTFEEPDGVPLSFNCRWRGTTRYFHSKKCLCGLEAKAKKENKSIKVRIKRHEDNCCCIPLVNEPWYQTYRNVTTEDDTNEKSLNDNSVNIETETNCNVQNQEDTNEKIIDDNSVNIEMENNAENQDDTNDNIDETRL